MKNYISGAGLFFDLEKDKHKAVNLIHDAAYQGEIRRLETALDAAFQRYADAGRDGRYQFPKGMGQVCLCSPGEEGSAYRQEYKRYYGRENV